MRSSLFLSIAVLVVRVTRILAVAESDGEGLFPDLDPTYVAMDQPFVPPADLQSIPSDSDMWDTEEESDLGNLYLSSFDLNPGSFDLASSEPYIGPDLETGDLDDYKSDPLAKCPIETYTKAACCATVLSDNRYIPNCSPSIQGVFCPQHQPYFYCCVDVTTELGGDTCIFTEGIQIAPI